MNASDLKKLKSIITKKLEEVREDIERLKEVSKPVEPENSLGRISRMDAIQSMNMNKALLQSKREESIKLEQTLAQIDTDKLFGKCIQCNTDIPIQRLIRIPESKLCVPCIKKNRNK